MTSTLPEVIALLEEAKEELEGLDIHRSSSPSNVKRPILDVAARVHTKITLAQNALMGEEPYRPEDN